ncbi:hypothetical protein BDV27DRAFT_8715 [Aspergillus caelatus]|uniref:Uncharacterized protein n=1 Tax=Aspergillus caelatus TaxID=61420 RepID=A0A5N7A154_9EURO|nr:uncharacterized protein BDV27DRAFT_8715 [Aspergillus caelatus]KAE8363283.1 hypothetical protein BDV27DRAFT_8715 [Aspergillus caelatus]
MLDVTSVVPLRVLEVLQGRSAAFTATNGSLSEMPISKDPRLVVRNVAVVSAQMMVGVDGVSRSSPLSLSDLGVFIRAMRHGSIVIFTYFFVVILP